MMDRWWARSTSRRSSRSAVTNAPPATTHTWDSPANRTCWLVTCAGERFSYRQKEGAFSQPNAQVCQKMLTFAVECTRGAPSPDVDLLELYCGNHRH
eukprot:COSAG04_NODE_440_length_14411_cov_40.575112_8_plen_97_part_00